MARRKIHKINFNQEIQICSDESETYSFVVEQIIDPNSNKPLPNKVKLTEYKSFGDSKIISDQYEGTPEEIEKFVHRDYEMIIKLPTIGF